jgi:predicted nucleic acid-binding Zn finger protein
MATTSMQAHATELLNRADHWSRGYRKSDGLQFVLFTGSKRQTYMATESGCTCKSYQYRGECAHVTAIRLEAIAARIEAMKPKRRLEDIWPDDMECAF